MLRPRGDGQIVIRFSVYRHTREVVGFLELSDGLSDHVISIMHLMQMTEMTSQRAVGATFENR